MAKKSSNNILKKKRKNPDQLDFVNTGNSSLTNDESTNIDIIKTENKNSQTVVKCNMTNQNDKNETKNTVIEPSIKEPPILAKENITDDKNAIKMDFMPLDIENSKIPEEIKDSIKKLKTNNTLSRRDKSRKIMHGRYSIYDNCQDGCVLYIGHIPHGFYEDQMNRFFRQFGNVKKLRISRNKKTGKSKGYGFIEFESPEVAEIVKECMNNYLLFGRVLKVDIVPKEKLHPHLWKGTKTKFKIIDTVLKERKKSNRIRSVEEQEKRMLNLVKRERKKRKMLHDLDIHYEFPGYEVLMPKKPTHLKF